MLQSLTRTGLAMLSCCILACTQDSDDPTLAEADVGTGGVTEAGSTSGGVPGPVTGGAGTVDVTGGDATGVDATSGAVGDSATTSGAVLEGTDEGVDSGSTSWRSSGSTGAVEGDETAAGETDVEETAGSDGDVPGSESEGGGESTGGTSVCPAPSSSAEVDALEELSDEFDDPATFCAWRFRHQVEGSPSQIRSIDLTETEQGFLTLVPETSGWYADFDGPFLFKEIEGDFIVETSVSASSLADPESAPMQPFSSAGLLIRDPASVSGAQHWVMWDLGRQIRSLGAEAKTTRSSGSQLFIYDGYASGVLRICRRGGTVDLALRNAETGAFEILHSFARSDLPANLQVGVVTTAWNGTGSEPNFDLEPDLIARWDYFRVRPIAEADDCIAE